MEIILDHHHGLPYSLRRRSPATQSGILPLPNTLGDNLLAGSFPLRPVTAYCGQENIEITPVTSLRDFGAGNDGL